MASLAVTLDEDECWSRLARSRHGVLATLHPVRGVDAVPVVYAISGRRILVPVDTVKAKQSTRLARLANIHLDGRCVFLVDHYQDDWSRLWWVRIHAHAVESPATDEFVDLLTERYPQYREAGAIASVVRLTPSKVSGWAEE